MFQDAHEIVTKQIIEQLEQGVVPWRKTWRGRAGLPKNIASGREYRGINVMLLGGAAYDSPYWGTFRQVSQLGGYVRRGERSTSVVFWKWIDRDEVAEDGTVRERRTAILRCYRVFNREQVDGIELPVSDPGAESAAHTPIDVCCDTILAGMPQAPAVRHNDGRAFYRPSDDSVHMPRPTLFESPEHYYAVLFHELTHATGAAHRVGRNTLLDAHRFGDPAYCREELVAELGAAMLCGHSGIENATIENQAAYVAGWLSKLRGDNRMVVHAAAQAQKAADFVLGRAAASFAEVEGD